MMSCAAVGLLSAAVLQVVDKSRYAAGDNSLEREIQVLCKVRLSSSSMNSSSSSATYTAVVAFATQLGAGDHSPRHGAKLAAAAPAATALQTAV
jgi:hypothetical protein